MLKLIDDPAQKVASNCVKLVLVACWKTLNAANSNDQINDAWVQINVLEQIIHVLGVFAEVVDHLLWLLDQPETDNLVEVPTQGWIQLYFFWYLYECEQLPHNFEIWVFK